MACRMSWNHSTHKLNGSAGVGEAAWMLAFLMLREAAFDIVRHTDVVLTPRTAQDVNEVVVLHMVNLVPSNKVYCGSAGSA